MTKENRYTFRMGGVIDEEFNNLLNTGVFGDKSKFLRLLIIEGLNSLLDKLLEINLDKLTTEPFIDEEGKIYYPKNIDYPNTYSECKQLIYKRDQNKCRKCRTSNNVNMYFIEKTNRLTPNNIILLCSKCKKEFKNYKPKSTKREFAKWLLTSQNNIKSEKERLNELIKRYKERNERFS